jgi:hypothetical protein
LRAEALPVFFDVNTFVAEVATPIHRTHTNISWYLQQEDIRFQNTGTLRISAGDIKLFKSTGKVTARIRNLDFVMTDAIKAIKHFPTYPFPVVVCMRAQAHGQTAATSVHIRAKLSEDYADDLRYLVAPVKKFLDDKITNPDFKGLSIMELQRLANTVRVPPKPGCYTLRLKLGKKKRAELAAKQNMEAGDVWIKMGTVIDQEQR